MPRKENQSPAAAYLNGQHGNSIHPATTKLVFSPGHHRGRNGAPRPPKMPEKPITPYVIYSQKSWDTVKQNNPDLKMWEISKFISKMWCEAADEEREVYIGQYEIDKNIYQDRMKQYYASPQYNSFLQAKQRWDAAEVRDDDEMSFSMEPVDDMNTEDNSCSHRAVHAMRYHRNTYFMMDIMSNTTINNHMKIMRQEQITALDFHRISLIQSIDTKQKEIEKAGDDHEAKKRRWTEKEKDLDYEWKRLAEMSPEEYFKEYKLKQEALKKQREEEEKKRREEEEKEREKRKLEEAEKAKNEISTPTEVSEPAPKLEQMETNQAHSEPAPAQVLAPESLPISVQDQNPLAAMNQLVGNVDKVEPKEEPKPESKPQPQHDQDLQKEPEPTRKREPNLSAEASQERMETDFAPPPQSATIATIPKPETSHSEVE